MKTIKIFGLNNQMNIKYIRNALVFFSLAGYLLLISPPRIYKANNQTATSEEIKNTPKFIIFIVEFMIRTLSLVCLSAITEYYITKEIYDMYFLDLVLMFIVLSGLIHNAAYFIFFNKNESDSKRFRLLFYRLIRNLSYIPLVIVMAGIPFFTYEIISNVKPLTSIYFVKLIYYFFPILFLISLAEAVLSKQKPLGV